MGYRDRNMILCLDRCEPAFYGVLRVAYFTGGEAGQGFFGYGGEGEVGQGGAALVEGGAVEVFEGDVVAVAPRARIDGGEGAYLVKRHVGRAQVLVNPFEGYFISVVGAVPALGFKPTIDVAVGKFFRYRSNGLAGLVPNGVVADVVDDDVGIAIENENRTMRGW